MAEQQVATPATEPPYPNAKYSWYVVIVLMLAYVFAFLDRQILALLVEPIKQDIGVTDFQMSLLLGPAFAFFYVTLGIPVGWLADRRSRRTIIGVGVAIWSIMTAACGLAKTFTHLLIARVGVGVGEATLQPCAASVISDYFPREKRGRAISVYSMGLGIGAGLALVLGGQVIAAVTDGPAISLPLIGEIYGWQIVFLVVGLPGLLVAALMVTVKEPTRRDQLIIEGQDAEQVPVRDVVRFLITNWRTYGSHFLGLSIMGIIGNAYLAWIPTVFIRTWGWGIAEISLYYGLVISVGGIIGVNLGGWMGDTMYKRGIKDGHMRAVLIGTTMLVIAAILVPLMPNPWWGLVLLAPHAIGSGIPTACGPTALMMITPNQMRGQISAVYWFVLSILGLMIGPTAVALASEVFFDGPADIRYGLSLVSAVTGSFIWILVFNLKPYRASVMEAESWSKATHS
ncbi:MAG: MFS transporter [Rhodospirillaceae bacterium]|nr:MFS transporter [Rhodospirillaceae bacterium]